MRTNFLLINKCIIILLILIFIGFSKKASANLTGIDISYQCTSTPGIISVTIKVYRDCGSLSVCPGCSSNPGVFSNCTTANLSLSTQIIGLSSSCLGTNFGSFTLTAVNAIGVYDIIKTCNNISSICNNCNIRSAGTFSPGVEVYTFEGNVNLSTIPTTCCRILLSANTCCRANTLTTISPGAIQAICELDRCQTVCNSAPTFTNNALAIVCAGVDIVYNLGAIDIDGDSLSYAFGQPLQGINTPVQYVAPFSVNYPFPYFGAPNATANLPAGLHINSQTGDIMFRPSGIFNSMLVIEVTQWKLVGGTRVNVGVTRRDVQFQTQLCLANKIPIIKAYRNGVLQTELSFLAYAGQQICFDIAAEDQQDLNVSPPILADTTDLTWNNPGLYNPVMANATFTRNYILNTRATSGPKADSFKFCWTPPMSAIRQEPHLFTVTGNDRNCPLVGGSTKGISIIVEAPKTTILSNTKNSFCFNQTTTVDLYYSILGQDLLPTNLFTVELSDSLGSFANPLVIGTKSSTASIGFIPMVIPSNLVLNKSYKLRVTSSSNNTIEKVAYDISIVAGIPAITISSNKNSFCKGSGLAVISATPNTGNYTFKWLRNNEIIGGANTNNYNTDSASNYRVLVSNAGCSDTSNSLALVIHPKPKAEFVCLDTLCKSELFNFIVITNNSYINNGTIGANWIYSDGTTDNVANPVKTLINNNNLTIKLVITSNNNCTDSANKTVVINQKPSINFTINDSSQCFKNNSFIFTKTITNANLFDWKFGDSTTSNVSNPTKIYSKTGTFLVRLFAQNNNGCSDSFSKTVTIYNNSNANFTINNAVQCLSGNIFSFTNLSDNFSNQIWSFGDTNHSTVLSPTKTYNSAGIFSVKLVVNDSNNCPDSLVKIITIYPKPIIGNITGNTTTNAIGIPLPYSVSSQTNTIYNWAATNGTIQSGQGTNSVNVIWPSIGTGSLKANITNSNGCTDSTNLAINITNVSVNNLSLENDLKVYPNPTKTSITITNKTNLAGKKYIITNLVGQTVLSGKLNLDETIVNLENLQSGIYLLSIDGLNKQSIKVIKE